jgi:hypothetical protein
MAPFRYWSRFPSSPRFRARNDFIRSSCRYVQTQHILTLLLRRLFLRLLAWDRLGTGTSFPGTGTFFLTLKNVLGAESEARHALLFSPLSSPAHALRACSDRGVWSVCGRGISRRFESTLLYAEASGHGATCATQSYMSLNGRLVKTSQSRKDRRLRDRWPTCRLRHTG